MAASLLDDDWRALFEAGTAHIVGVVAADASPFATRGWGARFSPDGTSVRLLLGATEVAALGYPEDDPSGATLALTCSTIRSLRSAQVKGPIVGVEPAGADDLAVLAEYCDGYFDAVLEVDLIARALMERMVPDELVACTFAVEEAYEQTPGPGAGRALGAGAP